MDIAANSDQLRRRPVCSRLDAKSCTEGGENIPHNSRFFEELSKPVVFLLDMVLPRLQTYEGMAAKTGRILEEKAKGCVNVSKMLKNRVRRLLSGILALTFVMTSALFSTVSAEEGTAAVQYGLHVESDGTVTMQGKPFYGMGVNFYNSFNRTIGNLEYEEYIDDFKLLSELGIPFIRVAFSPYYAINWQQYVDNPELYFNEMDRLVRTAEEYNIGIIASLFWWMPGVPDLMGESVNQIGNPNSKTVAFAKNYAGAVVERYVDSPALWGWEIGNEFNLPADLFYPDNIPLIAPHYGTPETRTAADIPTSEDVQVFYTQISAKIRTIDSYRMISNGDAEYRASQMNLRTNHNWTTDTLQQFKELASVFAPGDIDTVSSHIYDYDQNRFGRTTNIEEMLQLYVQNSRYYGKAFYFGEFSSNLGDEAQDKLTAQRVFNAIRNADVQLSSPWNYGMTSNGSFLATGQGSFMLDMISDINREYAVQGKQDLSKAWPKANLAKVAGDADHMIKRGVDNFDPTKMISYRDRWYGWSMGGEFPVSSFTADSTVKYNGASTFKIEQSGTNTRTSMQTLIPLEGNKTYTLTAYIKTQNVALVTGSNPQQGAFAAWGLVDDSYLASSYWGTKPSMLVANVDANENHNCLVTEQGTKTFTGTNDWTKVQVTFTTPAAATALFMQFQLRDATGTAWFGGLTLEEADNLLAVAGNADSIVRRGDNDYDPATMSGYINKWYGWSMGSDFPVTSFMGDSTVQYNGKSTFKITQSGTNTRTDMGTLVPVEANTTYKLSLYIKTQDLVLNGEATPQKGAFACWGVVGSDYLDAGYWGTRPDMLISHIVTGETFNNLTAADGSQALTGTTDWTKFEVTLTTPEGAAALFLQLQLRDATGSAWFGGLTLEKADNLLDLAGDADKLIKRGVNNFDPATMGEYLNTWFGWSMGSEFPVNSFTADSAVKYNAASTYKISQTGTNTRTHMETLVPVEANKTYTLTLYIKTTDVVLIEGSNPQKGAFACWGVVGSDYLAAGYWGTKPSMLIPNVDVYEDHNCLTTAQGGETLTGTTGWTKVQATVTTPAGAAALYLQLQLRDATGDAWFGGMTLVE